MTSNKAASKIRSMILGVLILIGIPALLTHCGFGAAAEEVATSGTRTDEEKLLPVQSGETIFAKNSQGNGEPFACEFKLAHGTDIYSFKPVNADYSGKKMVGICSLLKTGDLAKFRIIQVSNSELPAAIYWYPEDNFMNLVGTLVSRTPENKS